MTKRFDTGYSFIGASGLLTDETIDQAIEEATPRSELVNTEQLEISDGKIQLKDGAIVSDLIANDAITSGKIADDAVTSDHIGPGAVNSDALGAGVITAAKLASGAVTETKLANGAIATAKLANGSVTAAKLASDAVGLSIGGGGSWGTPAVNITADNWRQRHLWSGSSQLSYNGVVYVFIKSKVTKASWVPIDWRYAQVSAAFLLNDIAVDGCSITHTVGGIWMGSGMSVVVPKSTPFNVIVSEFVLDAAYVYDLEITWSWKALTI
ncbi:MAG: hypothetical protein EOM20_03310 [Spartobacteria bacterium]|nr:hypothetical protein [Spartobacteria bacterium]